jgi:hypothetical protein
MSKPLIYSSANLAKPLDQLDGYVSSELEGNPPIWITRIKGQYRDDLYVNNARILQERSNYIQINQQHKQQVLHVIDKVLVPVRSANKDTAPIYNPDAFRFLNQSEKLDIEHHRLRYVICMCFYLLFMSVLKSRCVSVLQKIQCHRFFVK